MREAISNAMIFNLVIIFVAILLAFFIGSLSYSKASKVKNRIVEVIEKEQGYDDIAKTEINNWLGEIGYRVNTNIALDIDCPSVELKDASVELLTGSNDYEYCVYRIRQCDSADENRCDTYYRVIAYMYFDVPIVQDLVKIPVTGETMSFIGINS